MNRRNFLTLFSVSLFASCSPLLFAASYAIESKQKSKKNSSKSKRWISVGTVEDLDKAGQILKEESSLGAILVIGTSKSKNLIAVNPTCSHLGCNVD
ncbi:MAG: cytochrome B6, partial [Cyanobacteria bacterium J06636_27]